MPPRLVLSVALLLLSGCIPTPLQIPLDPGADAPRMDDIAQPSRDSEDEPRLGELPVHTARRPSLSSGHISFGTRFGSRLELSDDLQNDESRPPADGLGIGFGGSVFIGRVHVGGSGEVHLGQRLPEGTPRSSATSGMAMLQAGYALHAGRRHVVYPSVGLGVGGLEVGSTDGDGAPVPHLRSSFLVTGAHLNGDLFIGPRSRSGNLTLGASVGYEVSHLHSEWASRDGEAGALSGLTPSGPSSVVVKLKVGWGIARLLP